MITIEFNLPEKNIFMHWFYTHSRVLHPETDSSICVIGDRMRSAHLVDSAFSAINFLASYPSSSSSSTWTFKSFGRFGDC